VLEPLNRRPLDGWCRTIATRCTCGGRVDIALGDDHEKLAPEDDFPRLHGRWVEVLARGWITRVILPGAAHRRSAAERVAPIAGQRAWREPGAQALRADTPLRAWFPSGWRLCT